MSQLVQWVRPQHHSVSVHFCKYRAMAGKGVKGLELQTSGYITHKPQECNVQHKPYGPDILITLYGDSYRFIVVLIS